MTFFCITWWPILILSPHLRLVPQMASFIQVSSPKPSIHTSFPTYVLHASPFPSSLILITRILPGEQYRSLSFSLRSLFSPCHLDHLRAKYPPQKAILKHPNLCSFPTVAHQISHPNTTVVTSQLLYIIILTFSDSKRWDKIFRTARLQTFRNSTCS